MTQIMKSYSYGENGRLYYRGRMLQHAARAGNVHLGRPFFSSRIMDCFYKSGCVVVGDWGFFLGGVLFDVAAGAVYFDAASGRPGS